MTFDLDAIRVRLDDPMSVATALGLVDGHGSVRRLARGIIVRCPSHAERTPSCSLSPSGRGVMFCCFGCGATGGIFDLVAAAAQLDAHSDFRRVVELAAQLAGLTEDEDAPFFEAPARPPEPERLSDDAFDAIASVVARLCPVAGEPDVAAYLAGRGLRSAAPLLAALPRTDAGYDRLIAAIVAEVGEADWRRSGLANERGGFVFHEHRLVAFWRSPGTDGLVQTIQRRLVRPAREGERVGKYVFASGRSPRWPYGLEHEEALGPGGAVAFVEGFMDTLAMRALCAAEGADRLVLGIPGTSGWSSVWAGLASGRVALVALDDDDAGEKAAERISADLIVGGAAAVHRHVPDGGTDWCGVLARLSVAA